MTGARLFGLVLPADGTAVGRPTVGGPITSVVQWSAPFSGMRCTINAELQLFGRVRAVMTMELDGVVGPDHVWSPTRDVGTSGRFALIDGTGRPPQSGIVVSLVGISIVSAFHPGSVTAKDGVLFVQAELRTLIDGDPLSLELTGPLALALSATDATLDFAPGALSAITMATAVVDDDPSGFFVGFGQRHGSLGLSHGLARAAPLEMRFVPNAVGGETLPLPLGIDRYGKAATSTPTRENPLVAAMTVAGHTLDLTLTVAGGSHQVTALSLAPQNGHYTVTAHGVGRSDNAPLTLTTPDRIPLQLRVPTNWAPSGVHIAGNVRAAATHDSPGSVHGPLEHALFDLPSALHIVSGPAEPPSYPPPAAYHPALHCGTTYPYLADAGDGAPVRTRLTRAGFAYDGGGGTAVETYAFKGTASANTGFALPLTRYSTLARWATTSRVAQDHLAGLDARLAAQAHVLTPVTHETKMVEAPFDANPVKPKRVFGGAAVSDDPARLARFDGVNLTTHRVTRKYGPFVITIDVPDGKGVDYVVLRRSNLTDLTFPNQLALDPSGGFTLDTTFSKRFPPIGDKQVVGLLKLTQKKSLREIFDDAPEFDALTVKTLVGDQPLFGVIDDSVTERIWTGLLLLGVGLDFNSAVDPVMGTLLNGLGLDLAYLAVTPTHDRGPGDASFTGHLFYVNDTPANDAKTAPSEEVTFRLDNVEAAWQNSSLNLFNAHASITVPNFFGRTTSAKAPQLAIIGTYDRPTQQFHLIGRFSDPISLIPDDWDLPLKNVAITGAEIRWMTGAATIVVDGFLELKNYTLGGVKLFDVIEPHIDFSGLQFPMPGYKPGRKNWLEIHYPSFALRFNGPQLSLGFFRVALRSLFVDWGMPNGLPTFDWDRLVDLRFGAGSGKPTGPSFVYGLRLELMKLPELSLKGVDRFILDLFVGLPLSAGDWKTPHFAIGAFSFDHLHLDVMRFLSLHADSIGLVEGQDSAGARITWLEFENASVAILGHTVVPELSLFLYWASGEFGILGTSKTSTIPGLSFIGLEWILIGHNVMLDNASARDLVAIGAGLRPGETILKGIREKRIVGTGKANEGRWIFAGGFSFAGLFDGKFLFADGAHYGIELEGPLFQQLFGYDFAISVLYNRGATAAEDSFDIAVRVPMVDIGPTAFTGGVIELEIFMNGGFTVDLGFPRLLSNGIRDWSRALGAIVTPFQGSGGIYFQRHHGSRSGADWAELAAGYAAQFGLGASGGGTGPFRVWVTAGVYATIEGIAEWTGPSHDVTYLQLTGTIGIVVRGGGELNFWIISVRVEITLGAEASLMLTCGRPHSLPGPYDAAKHTDVQLDMRVWAQAHAEACIGGGWFKLCASIDVTVPLHFGYTFRLN